ncbi:MAG TPA: hypothetical protein VH724_08395 [Candidatus Angelobacter sp.]|jgi:hypothetical protein|nr:hypothetical protein [Candidatus Angelobacter sp.]
MLEFAALLRTGTDKANKKIRIGNPGISSVPSRLKPMRVAEFNINFANGTTHRAFLMFLELSMIRTGRPKYGRPLEYIF